MAAAKSRMCFVIMISGLSFKWVSFSLKPGQPRLFSKLNDQLQHAQAIVCRLQPRLDNAKAEGEEYISFTLH